LSSVTDAFPKKIMGYYAATQESVQGSKYGYKNREKQ
jgi:hypothetical protein